MRHYGIHNLAVVVLGFAALTLLASGCSVKTHAADADSARAKPSSRPVQFEHIGQVAGAGHSEESPFNRGGSRFITMNNGEVRVYDTHTLKPVTQVLRHPGADQYGLTADGNTCFTAADHAVWIWDVATSQRRSLIKVSGERPIDTLEFSADGEHCLTSVGDNVLTLWRVGHASPTAKLVQGISLPVGIFDPTGTRIVTHVHSKGFHIWDAETGKETCPMIESYYNGFAPFHLPFDPQGHRLLLQLWYEGFLVVDPATGKAIGHVTLPKEWEADKLFFADDGKRIIVLSYHSLTPCSVRVYDSKTLKLEREFGDKIVSCAASEHGHLALFIPETPPNYAPELWDFVSGTRLQTFPAPANFKNCHLSPDGSTILINSFDGTTEVWRRRE